MIVFINLYFIGIASFTHLKHQQTTTMAASSSIAPATAAAATAPSGSTVPTVEMKDADSEVLSLDPTPVGSATIKLVSKDHKTIEVDRKCMLVSTVIKTSLEGEPTATEVPVPGVNFEELQRVVEYCVHHDGKEGHIPLQPLRSKVMKDVCQDAWDADFIDRVGECKQKLYDLILAANYMDIKSLLHVGCAKVATLIKGQPLEKIKDILTTDGPMPAATPAPSGECKEAKA